MKKRILSLLLAFAMAATLAPATALVGSDSVYAYSGNEAEPIIKVYNGKTDVTSGTIEIIKGTKQGLVIKDTNNVALVTETSASNTVVSPSISVDAAATNEIKILDATVTTDLTLLRTDKYEKAISVDVPANYNGTETDRTITLKSKIQHGVNTVPEAIYKSGQDVTFKVKPIKYVPEDATISLSKTKYLVAKVGDSGKFSIKMVDKKLGTGAAYLGAITYEVTIQDGDGTANYGSANMRAGDVFVPSGGSANGTSTRTYASLTSAQAGGVSDDNIVIASNAAVGTYKYTVFATPKMGAVAIGDKTPVGEIKLTVGDGTVMTLEADGGKIESAGWVLNSGSEYSKEANQGGTIALPYATKPGYEFVGWSTNGTMAGLVSDAGSAPNYEWSENDGVNAYPVNYGNWLKAVWRSKLNIYFDNNGATITTAPIGTEETVAIEVGKPINKGVKFTAVGYTMTGWSTQPGATVPLYKPEEVVTEKIFRDLTAAAQNDTLYATWAAKKYTIKYVPDFPEDVKESVYSKAVASDTKTYGKNLTLPDCTYYTDDGMIFDGWKVASQSGSGKVTLGAAGASVTDAQLQGTAGMRDTVIVYASWKPGYSQALLPEAGQKAYKIIENVNAAALSINAGESGKKGWLVEKWTDSEGQEHSAMTVNTNNTITTNAVAVPKHTVMTPTYYKNPIEYPVIYDTSVPGGSTNKLSGTFNVTETFNLHQPTAANLVFGGYTAYVYDTTQTGSAGIVRKIGQFTRTANGAKLLDEFIKAEAEAPMAGDASYGQYGVLFVANWLYKINKAQVVWAPTTVPYGTSLFAIADQLTVNLFYEETATSGRVNELGTLIGPNAGVKSITWTSATPIYDQKPSKLTKYGLNGVVVPDESVVSASANLTIYAEITMQSKVGDGIVALDVADIPSIDLPATAVAADLYAALNTVNTVYVKGDDAKNYLAGLIKSEDDIAHDWVDAADDFLLPNDNDKLDAWIANPDGGKYNFLFMSKLGNVSPLVDQDYKLTESERAGLEYVDNAQNNFDQYAFVYVNVGGKATPGTIMTPEITEVPEVDDEKLPELKGGVVYRFYNPNNGDHLYTMNDSEITLLRGLGWQQEKPTFQAVAYDAEGAVPVYRLWNPNSGEHFYTTSKGERNTLVRVHKWNYDGVFFYAYSAKSKLGVPVYRVWNPNADKDPKSIAGSHHWTTKVGEYNELARLGWQKEGAKFRAIKAN